MATLRKCDECRQYKVLAELKRIPLSKTEEIWICRKRTLCMALNSRR